MFLLNNGKSVQNNTQHLSYYENSVMAFVTNIYIDKINSSCIYDMQQI